MRLAAPLTLAPGITAYRQLAGTVAALHAAARRDSLQALLRRTSQLTSILTLAGWAGLATLGSTGISVIFGRSMPTPSASSWCSAPAG
jgi:peptidoglycan biosynthesis protein MviN/MurJ (putative lipid II flippase)